MESLSKYIRYNGTEEQWTDENGALLEGPRLSEDKKTILRFRHGFLDGDVYRDGVFVMQKPAVEGTGHLEYWRKNKLHRDGGLEAVCSKGFSVREFWSNGIRQKDK